MSTEAAPRSVAEIGTTRADARTRLGISQETLRRYVNAGRLDQVKIGPRKVLITWESLERLLQGRA